MIVLDNFQFNIRSGIEHLLPDPRLGFQVASARRIVRWVYVEEFRREDSLGLSRFGHREHAGRLRLLVDRYALLSATLNNHTAFKRT